MSQESSAYRGDSARFTAGQQPRPPQLRAGGITLEFIAACPGARCFRGDRAGFDAPSARYLVDAGIAIEVPQPSPEVA